MNDVVIFEQADGIATLRLNRTAQRNALNRELWSALEAHVGAICAAGDTIGAVILAANGPTFCAGNDLKERGITMPRPNYQASIISQLADLPQPLIVAVQGGCYTGGLELALAGDIIIASDDAVFADTHGKFALVPVWGMSQRLPRRVGEWKAREMSFTGLAVSGVEAARIGLANHVVPAADLHSKAMDMATAIAAQSRHSVFAYKRLYRQQADLPLSAGLAHEVYASAGTGPDMADRVAAMFGQKV